MALTLAEAAKLETGDIVRRAVIEQYAASSGVLMVLPFTSISGNALRYSREETLPGIGFRGVNEAYPESTGILNPIVEALVIAGGDVDVDKFITCTMGPDQRSVQEMMKIKALALAWERTFFKGDSTANPRQFDGLQSRLTGAQKISAGPGASGNPLSFNLLDGLIDQVKNPTHLFMNKTIRRLLTAAARNMNLSGFFTWTRDNFGRQVAQYNGLPIIAVDHDNEDHAILGFDETSEGGAVNTTSIYCVSLGDGALTGLQNGQIDVRDLGELQEKPALRTRVEWYSGIAIYHGRSAARLYGLNSQPMAA